MTTLGTVSVGDVIATLNGITGQITHVRHWKVSGDYAWTTLTLANGAIIDGRSTTAVEVLL